ncbi:methyltransferase domain-containing protein [Candidatus Saccharibacteria bacterium]|nr:methyltransferase domain-containing protein [Candidatus Saccharibacteria bacterium]
MKKEKFDSFFKIHSENVDNANGQGFWKLSDEIVKNYLLEIIKNRNNVTIVDFGGGTGRWAKILDGYLTNSHIIIIDLSKDMLGVAAAKKETGDYKNQISLINADIANVQELDDGIADYIISTYNPLSFVDNPQDVINEAYRIVKQNGKVAITTQAYYNALYSKIFNYQAEPQELLRIQKDKKLVWNDFVPETWQLSQEDMENMFGLAGFKNIESRGIACVTQPQDEDWDQTNVKIGKLSKKLNSDQEFFDTVLQLELAVGKDQQAVNRGMNIMTIGEK